MKTTTFILFFASMVWHLECIGSIKNSDNKTPLTFIENNGQIYDAENTIDESILFSAKGKNMLIYLTSSKIYYQFLKPLSTTIIIPGESTDENLFETHLFTMELIGSNPSPDISKLSKIDYYEIHHNGLNNTNSSGIKAEAFSKIVYHNIYPNIDWIIYANDDHIKYDFIVYPGGNPSLIAFKYNDGEAALLENGSLQITTCLGQLTEKKPFTFQGENIEIASKFILNTEDNSIQFSLEDYDARQMLTIDPNVVWATYYGGSLDDEIFTTVTDSDANVYIGGWTNSSSNISHQGYQNNYAANQDAFLVKFDTDGNRVWATYFGGTQTEWTTSVSIDGSDNVYLAGYTNSQGLATTGAYQTSILGDSDAFIAKFQSDGTLLWATYYGGVSLDQAFAVKPDKDNNVYLTGLSHSQNLTHNGHQQIFGGGANDVFLVKFDSSGTYLWSTYYGGIGNDQGYGVATDEQGNVYIGGRTGSINNISTVGAHQTSYAGGTNWGDGFLVKFNGNGDRIWATYFGGSNEDFGRGVATDNQGSIYLVGRTNSANGITSGSGSHQNNLSGGVDGFLVKFNPDGMKEWSTYYGGFNDDEAYAVHADRYDFVFICGRTNSTNAIAYNGYQNNLGGDRDGFIAGFDPSGTLLWGTYYGSTNYDNASGITSDKYGSLYIAGGTESLGGIAMNGFQNSLGGMRDAMLVKFESINLSASNPSLKKCSNVFPNPASDNLTISGISSGQVIAYNSLGELVLSSNFSNTISLNRLPSGLYFLVVKDQTNNRSCSHKVIRK